MMDETIGQREDDKAFEEMAESWQQQRAGIWEERGDWPDLEEQVAAMRFAYDAGMERGLEKRGCCEDER